MPSQSKIKRKPLGIAVKQDICLCHMLQTEPFPFRPLYHNTLTLTEKNFLLRLLSNTFSIFTAVIRQNVSLKSQSPTVSDERKD